MKLSIIIPAYNEELRIGKTIKKYLEFFDFVALQSKIDYEIIIVINNTKDRTEDIVKSFQGKNKKVKYLNFLRGGKGFAITEGFKYALKRDFDVIGFVDADMATSPDSFYELVKNLKWHDGAIANRYDSKSIVTPAMTFRRLVVAQIFNVFVRALFLFNYRDTQCGAKVFRCEVIKYIVPRLSITQWAFDIDILYQAKCAGFKIISCPTRWNDIEGSKINLIGSSINMLFAVVQLRIIHSLLRRLLLPLRKLTGILYLNLISRRTTR